MRSSQRCYIDDPDLTMGKAELVGEGSGALRGARDGHAFFLPKEKEFARAGAGSIASSQRGCMLGGAAPGAGGAGRGSCLGASEPSRTGEMIQ